MIIEEAYSTEEKGVKTYERLENKQNSAVFKRNATH